MRANEFVSETWSAKYKRSIDCSNPKGFSQKAHCAGRKKNEDLTEFAPASNPGGGNYLLALASAWYNGTFNTGDLHKGIKSQEDVEKILARGIHCGDGKVRKYSIGYNSGFDGVEIQSDDHYEYADYDDAGNDIDSRTGKPWGPYDVVEFSDSDLNEDQLNEFAPGNGDDREPNEEEILRQLAAQWWLGTEQQMAQAQRTLETMGWEIGQDESGDDDAGVFLVRASDENGDSYIAFNHSDLSQLNELTFKGSPCTKDCSGHRAGYDWSMRKGGVDAASWSPSFNTGASLFKNGY